MHVPRRRRRKAQDLCQFDTIVCSSSSSAELSWAGLGLYWILVRRRRPDNLSPIRGCMNGFCGAWLYLSTTYRPKLNRPERSIPMD